jgi:hypothetical protein
MTRMPTSWVFGTLPSERAQSVVVWPACGTQVPSGALPLVKAGMTRSWS